MTHNNIVINAFDKYYDNPVKFKVGMQNMNIIPLNYTSENLFFFNLLNNSQVDFDLLMITGRSIYY